MDDIGKMLDMFSYADYYFARALRMISRGMRVSHFVAAALMNDARRFVFLFSLLLAPPILCKYIKVPRYFRMGRHVKGHDNQSILYHMGHNIASSVASAALHHRACHRQYVAFQWPVPSAPRREAVSMPSVPDALPSKPCCLPMPAQTISKAVYHSLVSPVAYIRVVSPQPFI